MPMFGDVNDMVETGAIAQGRRKGDRHKLNALRTWVSGRPPPGAADPFLLPTTVRFTAKRGTFVARQRNAGLVGGNGVTKADKRYAALRTATLKYDLVADPYELDNKVKHPRYAPDVAMLRDLHDRLKSCVGEGCWVP
jgi:hypothetical protein